MYHVQGEFEDTKGASIICKSKNVRQHNLRRSDNTMANKLGLRVLSLKQHCVGIVLACGKHFHDLFDLS